jgi:hypothetical protein
VVEETEIVAVETPAKAEAEAEAATPEPAKKAGDKA